ncbi:MAG: VOC family protein [Bryobacteraceae bacterium]|jgi:catechol 2,3-dioxygenase-like lactoylglutathione lyase family enzyme
MSTSPSASQTSPLRSSEIVAFVGVTNPERAKAFYRDTLGLALVSEDGFALVFDASGTMLRVSLVREVMQAQYTVLGWEVADIAATAKHLQQAGVTLERYAFLQDQDALGIWTAPGGARVAWFKDPDGNILSISQHS